MSERMALDIVNNDNKSDDEAVDKDAGNGNDAASNETESENGAASNDGRSADDFGRAIMEITITIVNDNGRCAHVLVFKEDCIINRSKNYSTDGDFSPEYINLTSEALSNASYGTDPRNINTSNCACAGTNSGSSCAHSVCQ